MSHICTGLYHCNSWSCNRCLAKKVYWLREQSISFARQLANVQTTFTTLKNFNSADECSKAVKALVVNSKRANKRYNAKFEYFYVISNHEFSGWHAHIISNGVIDPIAAHIQDTRDLKAAALYLVANLKRSCSADYAKTRRYGGSSLLYKQSMKNYFKTRARLWSIKTQLFLAMVLLRALSYRDCVRPCVQCDRWLVVDVSSLQSFLEFLPIVERPPPRNQKCH